LAGIGNTPEDDEVDVDDVLVTGDHLTFVSNVTARGAVAADVAEADLDTVVARDLGGHHGLDRIGNVIMQSRRGRADPFAKTQDDALLLRVDPVEAGQRPDRDCHDQEQ